MGYVAGSNVALAVNAGRGVRHLNRDSIYAGKCLVCGRSFETLTHNHAEGCGYESREALIAAGQVEFYRKRRGTTGNFSRTGSKG